MKRKIRLMICLALVSLVLCACAFDLSPEASPVAQDMMRELARGNKEAALSLMHPDMREQIKDLDKTVEDLIEFVDGRCVQEWKQTSINVRNQVGTNSGKFEEGTFRVTLDDGTVLKIDYEYSSNKAGKGFISFYLSVGK